MPRLNIDYSKTIFYRIVCNDLNIKDCYIGQTTNFINRKRSHKKSCNNEKENNYNLKVYNFIRENGGWDNWSMIMIEQISCENFNEACKIERKFLEEYNATLNKVVPTRTRKEWREDNKESMKEYHKEYHKEWYEKNKDKKKEQKKEYRKEYDEKNKEKIKARRKEYNDKNKDKIKEYNKEYKEKIKLQNKSI